MRNIIRTDPFNELVRVDPFRELREFDGLMSLPRLRRWLTDVPPAESTIKLDVTEDEKAYRVKADLPGVKREDIDVQIDGNQVSLTAEVQREKEEKKGETVVYTERFYGKQFRSFTLASDIDEKKAEAKFADGVLELTLPKSGAPTQRKLAVQ
jgi:HSP20 family protein